MKARSQMRMSGASGNDVKLRALFCNYYIVHPLGHIVVSYVEAGLEGVDDLLPRLCPDEIAVIQVLLCLFGKGVLFRVNKLPVIVL